MRHVHVLSTHADIRTYTWTTIFSTQASDSDTIHTSKLSGQERYVMSLITGSSPIK